MYRQNQMIFNKLMLAAFWLYFSLTSSSLWSFDVINVTSTSIDERNHSAAVKDRSIYLVWEANNAIYFSKSKDGGKNWFEPIILGKGVEPSIAVGRNNFVYVTWWYQGIEDTVFSTYSDNDGVDFPLSHRKIVGKGNRPDVFIDTLSQIHIVWFLYYKEIKDPPIPYNTFVVYSRILRPDSSFDSVINVAPAIAGWAGSLDLVIDDKAENIYVAWNSPSPHYILVHIYVSRNSGMSFEQIRPEPGGHAHGEYHPCLAFFSNNDIYHLWESDNYGWYDVLFLKYEDYARKHRQLISLNKEAVFRGSLSQIFFPSIAVDQNNKLYAAWTCPRKGYKDSTDIYFRVSIDSGKSFGNLICLTDSLPQEYQRLSSKRNPSIAIVTDEPGTISFIWEDNIDGNYEIYCATKVPIPTAIRPFSPNELPYTYQLEQNYPNPFNEETRIRYEISKLTKVTLKVYNILGEEVAVLIEENMKPGIYLTNWNGKNKNGESLASGIYVCRFQANDFSQYKKMALIR